MEIKITRPFIVAGGLNFNDCPGMRFYFFKFRVHINALNGRNERSTKTKKCKIAWLR